MKCNSCGVEVPSEFKQALAKNVCPGCEGPIMTDAMQELLVNLKDALERMPSDAQGLAGWLVSNYEMRKVGTGEPVQSFYGPKSQMMSSGGEDYSNLKTKESKLEKFQKSQEEKQNKRYKSLLKQIHGTDPEALQDQEYEQEEPDDQEGLAEEKHPEFTKNALKAMKDTSESMDRDSMRKLAKKMKQKQEDQEEDEEIFGSDNVHEFLQKDRLERLREQREMRETGSKGMITRSSD